jgi:hypothetical protein
LIWIPIAAACLLLLVILMELSGVSRMLEKRLSHSPDKGGLHTTGYYGKPLEQDPYVEFAIQHLHPYYLFAPPWREADRERANSAIVSVNEQGFRNSYQGGGEPDAVLLGGSTAFGHKSTNNRATLAYRLSEVTPFIFVNRNAPSWNSHQELVALAKYDGRTTVSLSLSLANDINIYCNNVKSQEKDRIVDQPESFKLLSHFFNDIRAGPERGSNVSLTDRIKSGVRSVLPDTYALLGRIKIMLGATDGEGAAPGASAGPAEWYHDCGTNSQEDARAIGNSYLRNQKTMARITESKGGVHLVVLQPFSYAYGERDTAAKVFFHTVYQLVLDDPFCRDRCLDFSRIPGLENPGFFRLGAGPDQAHFGDDVHLTDRGVEAVVKALAPIIVDKAKRYTAGGSSGVRD